MKLHAHSIRSRAEGLPVVYKFGFGLYSGPEAGLSDVNGTLYGTTSGGGASNDGTVFRISP
jgi:uncharacterized repeat protein (TIGR03803 family)